MGAVWLIWWQTDQETFVFGAEAVGEKESVTERGKRVGHIMSRSWAKFVFVGRVKYSRSGSGNGKHASDMETLTEHALRQQRNFGPLVQHRSDLIETCQS
jgi:hypothetical protein